MSKRKNFLAWSAKPATESNVEYVATAIVHHEDEPIPTEDKPPVKPDGEFLSHDVHATNPDILGHEIISQDPVTDIANVYVDVNRIVGESFDEGGLSMEAAQILNVFSHYHGVPVRARVSVESFGTSGLYESRVAMEGIKEVIAAWWEKLKAWLVDARNKLAEWGTELLVKLTDLKSKGEALKESVSNAQPGSSPIDFPKKGLLKVNNEYPSIPQAFATLTSFADTAYVGVIEAGFENATRVGQVLSSFQLSGQQSLTQLVDNLKTNADVPAESYGRFLTNKVTEETVMQKLLKGNEGLNPYVLSSDKLLGNVQLVAGVVAVVISNNPVQDLSNLGKAIKFSELQLLTDEQEESDGEDTQTLPRLSPSDVSNIADNIIKMGGILEGSKDILSKKKQADQVIDSAGNAVNALNINESVEGGQSIAASLRSMVSSLSAQVQSPTMKVTMWLLSVTNAVGQYAKLSLSADTAPETQNQPA